MNKWILLFKQIRIHPLLWLVVGLAIITSHFNELFLLLLIIFVHEIGHAVAAQFFSWRIKSIVLLPFGGVAEMDEHGNRPLKEELMVILAGPIQHVWMIAVAFLCFEWQLVTPEFFSLFVQYNLMILLFNLLPIWPLDGGKLVFLYLSYFYAFGDAHRKALQLSIFMLILFLIASLWILPFNINICIILAFLLFSLYYEWKQRRYIFMRFLLERYYGKHSELRKLKPLVVKESEPIMKVLEKFQRGCKHSIIVETGNKEKSVLDENELLHAYFAEKNVSAQISDLVYVY